MRIRLGGLLFAVAGPGCYERWFGGFAVLVVT